VSGVPAGGDGASCAVTGTAADADRPRA